MSDLVYDRTKKESVIKQDVLRKAKDIFDNFVDYTDGIRVLFLIHRNKEGGETNNTKVRKIITKNSKEFFNELCKLVDEQTREKEIPYRIYSSLNARNVEKAIHKFKQEQLDADYYDNESRHSFYYDLKNRFIGALMTPSCAVDKMFLFDCDNEEGRDVCGEALQELSRLNAEIVNIYKTKNGFHIITKPFNPTSFSVNGVELKKDALLLLSY